MLQAEFKSLSSYSYPIRRGSGEEEIFFFRGDRIERAAEIYAEINGVDMDHTIVFVGRYDDEHGQVFGIMEDGDGFSAPLEDADSIESWWEEEWNETDDE